MSEVINEDTLATFTQECVEQARNKAHLPVGAEYMKAAAMFQLATALNALHDIGESLFYIKERYTEEVGQKD